MSDSSTVRSAMDFLVGRIAQQAEREGVSLSDVERKMLYFSETAWTLPDIAKINQEFDRTYDQAAYEKKVSGLIRNARAACGGAETQDSKTWTAAVRAVRKEDRYLRVMLDQAEGTRPSRGHMLRLAFITLIGCGVAFVVLLIVFHFQSS